MDQEADYHHEDDAQKVRIVINGDLSAQEVGIFITNVSRMYGVMNDYLGSSQELELISVKKGSYIIEFLADITTWDKMTQVWGILSNELQYGLGLIQGNAMWDGVKYLVFRRVTNDQMSVTENKEFTEAAAEIQKMAISNGCCIETDYQNKIVRISPPDKYAEFFKHEFERTSQYISHYEDLLEDQPAEKFPPRSRKHKKNHKRKW
jgi:hypothetical protein